MLFQMVSFFAKIDSISFWPKSLDYSKAFCSNSLRTHSCSLEGASKLKFAPLTTLESATIVCFLYSRTLDITLAVDEVKVQKINGDTVTLPMEKDRLMKCLRHQVRRSDTPTASPSPLPHKVVLHQMGVVKEVADGRGWRVVQELPHAVFSRALAKSPSSSSLHCYSETCNIVLLSPDAHRWDCNVCRSWYLESSFCFVFALSKVDLLLQWGRVTVSSSVSAAATGEAPQRDVASLAPQTKTFSLATQPGANFQQRLTSLFS